MAKFCTECGKELVDGKCSTCIQKNSNSFKIVDELKKYWECVKKSFKKPMDVLKENSSEDNFVLSLISISISSILCGLLFCFIAKGLFGGFSGFVKIPYFRLFITGFLISILLFSTCAVVEYVVFDKVFKVNTTIKKMFVLVGLSSIMISVALVISNLLALVIVSKCFKVICILLTISTLLWMIYMIKAYEYYAKKLDDNKVGYAFIIVYFVTLMIIYLILNNVLPNIMIK